MIRDYRVFTKCVNYSLGPSLESVLDLLVGPCQRCGKIVEMQRLEWEEAPICYWCASLEAEDALA